MTDVSQRESAMPPVSAKHSLVGAVREFLASAKLILVESAKAFLKNGGLDRSAALAFYGFLSMVPLLLLEVFVVARVIHSSRSALALLKTMTSELLPASSQFILNEVYSLSVHKSWGIVTIVALIWSATPLAGGIRNAFGAIFRPEKNLPFFKGIVLNVFAVVVTLTALGVVVFLRLGYVLWIPLLPPGIRGTFKCAYSGVLVLGLPLFLYLFYRMLIPARLKIRHLLFGSVVTAILLSVVGPMFTFVLKYNPNYGVTFGSLKAIFLLFVWVYYSFAAILLGTEIMASVARHDALVIGRLFTQPEINRGSRRLLNRFVRVFENGQQVFHEGDKGEAMFHVLRGSVGMFSAGKCFRVMKAGEYFGEMAMLLDAERTMSAIAQEPGTELVEISRENLETVLKENPGIVLSILREMAARLKHTNESINSPRSDQH
jgi:membrane protein